MEGIWEGRVLVPDKSNVPVPGKAGTACECLCLQEYVGKVRRNKFSGRHIDTDEACTARNPAFDAKKTIIGRENLSQD